MSSPEQSEPMSPDEGIGGVTQEELELLLEVLQQSNFPSWSYKLLAGRVQRRVDHTLKEMAMGSDLDTRQDE